MVTNLKDPIFSKRYKNKSYNIIATILLNADAFVIGPEKLIDFIKSSLLNG